jgi:hypothetical protein
MRIIAAVLINSLTNDSLCSVTPFSRRLFSASLPSYFAVNIRIFHESLLPKLSGNNAFPSQNASPFLRLPVRQSVV